MDPWGGAGAAAAAVVPSNGASASPAPTGIPGASATVNDPWSPVKEQPRTSPLPNLGGPPSLAAPSKTLNPFGVLVIALVFHFDKAGSNIRRTTFLARKL